MDLSIRCAETFDYRHKKFGQVRNSPLTLAEFEAEPQKCETNFYRTTQAQLKTEYQARDHNWELEMDELNRPSTPVSKKRRISKRKNQNFQSLDTNCAPNAPKKRKIQADAQVTPAKMTTLAYEAPTNHNKSTNNKPLLMPKISNEALARICQYNKNMVRKFPKKERSAKDQERRDKNTIACRMSRRLKKLENLAIEEQYKIFVQEHLEQQQRSMQAAVYLNELIKSGARISHDNMNELHNSEFLQQLSNNLNLNYLRKCVKLEEDTTTDLQVADFPITSEEFIDVESSEHEAQQKRPFTIAFLLGGVQQN